MATTTGKAQIFILVNPDLETEFHADWSYNHNYEEMTISGIAADIYEDLTPEEIAAIKAYESANQKHIDFLLYAEAERQFLKAPTGAPTGLMQVLRDHSRGIY